MTRRRRVGVVGAGYVGSTMAELFRHHHDVSVYDPKFENSVRGNVLGVDLAVVCVPTPMSSDGSADTSIVEEVAEWLDAPLVVVKSTVPPGTTDMLNRRHGDRRFHFSPEYVGEPGSRVVPWRGLDPRDPGSHPFVIVGGPRATSVLDFFLGPMPVDARFVACEAREAELAKYMENTYFALKVAFCSEWSVIARQFGVDYVKLRELWLLDPRVERDHTAVFPGQLGFRGKCLPKDLAAIVEASGAAGHVPELLSAVRDLNDEWTQPGGWQSRRETPC